MRGISGTVGRAWAPEDLTEPGSSLQASTREAAQGSAGLPQSEELARHRNLKACKARGCEWVLPPPLQGCER